MNRIKEAIYRAGLGSRYFEYWWMHRRKEEPKSAWSMQYQAFFVHIPKTAGTSLIKALDFEVFGYTHCPARCLKSIYPDVFDRYFKFAVVRNPFDKFVSSYEYVTRESDWEEQRKWAQKFIGDATLPEFVTRLRTSRSYRNLILGNEFFLPQTFFVRDKMGRSLVDFIMKFENLNADFERLKEIRFPDAQPLPHARKNSKRTNYRDYFDEPSTNFIRDYYACDFEAFNYD